jgi:mono/diheme cytochrome c family protein
MKESSVSQMPEGQLDELTPDELRDLFSYLQSESPKETETK